eukprot:1361258-Amphidinium_carterae.1
MAEIGQRELEKYQWKIQTLNVDEIKLALYSINPVVYHSEALNALKTSKHQREVPKTRLLKYLEVLTGVPESALMNRTQFKTIGA